MKCFICGKQEEGIPKLIDVEVRVSGEAGEIPKIGIPVCEAHGVVKAVEFKVVETWR